ncbi:hypothetical protein [Asanoa siamensis]|uniref:Uncharacterized protein n=1 Tax=Asanoa siamensis TaxID=926357 RepID=A0ABQ4CPV7_9ACTN|nr:hypothetical protein [Asanoa siamensis]GIF73333.1 hypothetical protein Asi02nite_28510 [Asanoa siamensis]
MKDLKQRLTALADDMGDTDVEPLRARVDRTARRIGRRRAAVATVAALALVGAVTVGGLRFLPRAQEAPQPATSTTPTPAVASATPTATPTAGGMPAVPPERWIAAYQTADAYAVREVSGRTSRELASRESNPRNGAPFAIVDLAAGGGGNVYVASCCEPVPGTVHKVVDGDTVAYSFGVRVDARGDLVAVTDALGAWMLHVDDPRSPGRALGEPVAQGGRIGASDAAVLPDGRVAVLINAAHFGIGADAPQLLLLSRDGARWQSRTMALERDYCAVVALAGGVGLVPARPGFHHAADLCVAERLDVRDLTTGDTRQVHLPGGPAAEVSTDDAGRYILATGTDGRLSWLTVDGRSGTLDAPGNVRAADW